MIGLGTLINVIAIIVGGTIGLFLKHNLNENYKAVMIQGIGLSTIVLGIYGSLAGLFSSTNTYIFLIIILSMVLGGMIGAFLKIENNLNKFGHYLQNRFAKTEGGSTKGFVTASIIFCVGAMAIMGSIQDGMSGDFSTLATKAILDGITSMILASTLGAGVIFSFIPVLIYQGSITLISHFFLTNNLTETVKTQIDIIGNLLIIGIGLELLEIKKMKIADMLPAIFLPIIYSLVMYLYLLIYHLF